MSNIGHFSRYRSIYGLTGTLGSDESKRFLKNIYDASMLDIPPYLERRLKIEDGYLMYSDSEWLEKIIENVQKMMNQKRSVLIICQTISDVKIIEISIKERCRSYKQIKTHQTGQQNHTDRVSNNQIIIATNVAGRGTDLKAQKQLIQKGGLHVIITFMPENLRVQMQARGRAGRNGAPGSSELIVNHKQYFDEMMKPPIQQELFMIQGWEKQIKAVSKHIRDQYEALSMKKDIQKVEQLKTKDRIFSYFCQTVGKISDYQTNKAKRDALEEAWAMFLKKAEYLKLSMQEMQHQGKQLIDQFGKNSDGFYNPSHSLWRGIDSIRNQNLQNAKGHFRELQKKESTITNKIAGKLMQSSLTIKMDDKKQKSNYGGALKQMESIFTLLQDRKDIVKASHGVSFSANSRQISDMMKSQSKRNEREKLKTVLKKEDSNLKALNIGLINSTQIKKIPLNMKNSSRQSVNAMQQQQDLNINHYLKNGNQIQRQENNQSHQNIELIQNSDLASQERRNIEQAMNIPEVNVLNSIGQHVKKQIEKIQLVSANQYAEITWQPLSSIIDITQGKEERTEQALQKVATDIPLLPVAEIKKIKVPWWKRALVFALGVFQICLGALILSASAGAAASFGAFMIQSGISDCMAAIFSPQVCDNLGKFYTKKALQYTMALATIGVQGMSQLASLSKNGFLTIKNSTMSQVMERAANGIKQGLIKGGFDSRGIVQKQIFEGISSKLTEHNKSLRNISPQQTFKAMKSGDLKNFIQQGSKEEDKIQKTSSQIRQRFQKRAESTINEIIATVYPNFLKQISSLKLKDADIRILIEEQFKNAFHNFFYDKDRKQIYKEMLHFISANIRDQQSCPKNYQRVQNRWTDDIYC